MGKCGRRGKASSMVPIPSEFQMRFLFFSSSPPPPSLRPSLRFTTTLSQLRSGTTSPARIPRQGSTNPLRLNTTKPLQLLRLHRDLLPEPDLPRRALDEAHTVRVQRLVDRCSARLGAGDGNTSGSDRRSLELVPLTETFDDGGFHPEFDPVEWDEPDDVLYIVYLALRFVKKINQKKRHTQTQTIPIHPPLIPLIFVKPQSPYAAIIELINCAMQKATMSAVLGRSMKKKLCARVTKINACEMTATWR